MPGVMLALPGWLLLGRRVNGSTAGSRGMLGVLNMPCTAPHCAGMLPEALPLGSRLKAKYKAWCPSVV